MLIDLIHAMFLLKSPNIKQEMTCCSYSAAKAATNTLRCATRPVDFHNEQLGGRSKRLVRNVCHGHVTLGSSMSFCRRVLVETHSNMELYWKHLKLTVNAVWSRSGRGNNTCMATICCIFFCYLWIIKLTECQLNTFCSLFFCVYVFRLAPEVTTLWQRRVFVKSVASDMKTITLTAPLKCLGPEKRGFWSGEAIHLHICAAQFALYNYDSIHDVSKSPHEVEPTKKTTLSMKWWFHVVGFPISSESL